MMTDVLLHMKYQINAAPMRQWPFPHLLVEDILPQPYYADMIQRMPRAEDFDKAEFGGRDDDERHRTILRMQSMARVSEADSLNEYMEWFTGGDLTPILMDRFRTMPRREEDSTPGHLSMILNDRKGYSIGPHMDIGAKLITMIIYTPARVYEQPHIDRLGTSLYQPKFVLSVDGRRIKAAFGGAAGYQRGRHYDFEAFDRIFTVPYKPNTALLFLSVDGSFHGVEPTPADRMTLQYQVVNADTTFAKSRGVQ